MTQAVVVRMTRKEIAEIDSIAKARATNRSAVIREATRKFVKDAKTQKGAGWPERLKRLRELDQKLGDPLVKGDIVEEIRSIDRNRCLL